MDPKLRAFRERPRIEIFRGGESEHLEVSELRPAKHRSRKASEEKVRCFRPGWIRAPECSIAVLSDFRTASASTKFRPTSKMSHGGAGAARALHET